ncbi:hypothetical protein ZYGR_0AS06000 [Zygosaccharomyces rouxii]|uniref:Nuclear mRNA export factor n=1 Tax=Zygosaccharomyces rouxii TaxID=4956 RepID=A0A1Q3AHR8_ZYGRO|nr:hypothetical protein ZYGR_0AS06000 [Zygosaccharomyces rouxii]
MSIPFGASTPASGFNFFNGQKPSHHSGASNTHNNNKSNGVFKIGDKKSSGGFRNSQRPPKKYLPTSRTKHSDKGRQASRENGNRKPKLSHINAVDNSKIGSLLTNPQEVGFRKVPHKPRQLPRFLINQQPHLKPKKFIQDPWDAANQQKMLQLESSIEDFSEMYETLKKMRDVERKMMESKHLVDKADSAKDLTEAIDFQGTCQDMCPIFERARRNVEFTVYSYEKNNTEDKKASRYKALKVFARPAAAAAPPLPSDVRPPHILVKSLDYIIENLLTTLPDSEGFIWDRMRSIRQDFTYQNYCGPEAIDCNERIVRIHLLIVHVMAKSNMEYSLQQELEQLHKSLITLSEIYDEVRSSGGSCSNEAEFRAYALLSRIRDPEYDKNLEKLPPEIFQNDLVQQAICFRRIVSNSNYVERGILRTENCLNFYQRFFQLIKTGRVPFLMCSFLELYVNEVRFYAFKALSYSVNKKHKPIPTEYFMENFAFNSQEELIEFCKYYSIEVTPDGVELKTLVHNSHRIPEKQPMKQAYLEYVDYMLQGSSYSFIINSGRPNIDTIPDRHNKAFSVDDTTEPDEIEQEVDQELGEGEESESPEIGGENTETEPNKLVENKNTSPGLGLTTLPAPSSFQQKTIESTNTPFNNKFPITIPRVETPVASVDSVGAKNIGFQPPQPLFGIQQSTNPSTRSIQANQVCNIPEFKQETRLSKVNNLENDKSQLIESQKKNKKEKEKSKNEAVSQITEEIIKDVVQKQITATIEKQVQANRGRDTQISELSEVLYQAFIHEKLYLIFLDSKAENHYDRLLERRSMNKWMHRFKTVLLRRELEQKRKEEIQRVGRQLGVPVYKKSKQLGSTPHSDDTSFSFSSTRKNGITFSPVNNEVNKFDIHADKRTNVWEPLALRDIYFNKISDNFFPPEEPITADLFIYGKNWNSVCGNWMINKFGLSNKETSYQLSNDKLKMNVRCIDPYYDPSDFTNLQLLVFNTGVTDSNIFDLELKLQQDGEELIKLITGISLNTNICFNLLVVYWESAETPLDGGVVSKCLKLNRIAKSFSSVLEQIGTININSNDPHEVLENGLIGIAAQYRMKLTDRGRYNRNLREKRTTQEASQLLTTRTIDERMKRMHESEEQKLQKLQDERNTYAHLQSHIAASPKLKKRKLPVLLSKNRDNRYETPQARRTASTSSSALFSHLAIKLGNGTRFSSFNLPPATPSHSTNLPLTLMDSNETPLLPQQQQQQQKQREQHERAIQEPALFQTPINSTTASNDHDTSLISQISSTPAADSPANVSQEIPSNLKELKNLIESVKTKVNGNRTS